MKRLFFIILHNLIRLTLSNDNLLAMNFCDSKEFLKRIIKNIKMKQIKLYYAKTFSDWNSFAEAKL